MTGSKYFDNEAVKEVLRKFTDFGFIDMEGLGPGKFATNLIDELPDNIRMCEPTTIISIPARYAVFTRLRDLQGDALRNVQRARKNERARFFNLASNPEPGTNPAGLTKVTEKAVESWVETRPEIISLNQQYDHAETVYTMLCSACEALRMYFDALKELLRADLFEERYASPPSKPRKRIEEEAEDESEPRVRSAAIDKMKRDMLKKKREAI